ncbi:MAG TPA: LPD38 domain-containing protein, partial [Thermoleophilia bacterium]|nr:LPD38 domain-containing protein [Thermoleophilia bacterium]
STSLTASFADSFNPLGGGGDPAQIVFPTLMKPIYQLGANVDWKGDPIKPQPFPFGLKKPQSQEHWKSVSPSAKWLANKLNSVTGGDDVIPGVVDVSPEYIEHFADFLFGGVGKFTRRTEVAIEKALVGEEIDVSRDIPFARRVYWTPDQRFQRNQYRDNQDVVEQLSARVRAYRAEGEQAKAKDLILASPALWRMVTPMKASQRRIKALNKRAKHSPDQQKAIEALLQAEYLRINKMFNQSTSQAIAPN